MSCARDQLSVYLENIVSSNSFWFMVNGDISHEISFARCLSFFRDVDYYAFLVSAGLSSYKEQKDGKKELAIQHNEWVSLLQDPLLNPHLFSFNMKRFDAKCAINGKQDDKKKMKYHIIRIGHESDDSPSNIGRQIKDGFTTSPHIQSISYLQRNFKNSVSRMITNRIVNDRDVYENLANRGDGYHSGSDDDSDLESDDEGDAEEGETDLDVTPKRKKKRGLLQSHLLLYPLPRSQSTIWWRRQLGQQPKKLSKTRSSTSMI